MTTTIEPLHAVLLGLIEGITEFLPVSSTGHLILVSHALGLRGEAVKTFQIVIQAGALVAVGGLYRVRLAAMWRGLRGLDPPGRRLLTNLFVSFLPAAVLGLLFHRTIKAHLFGTGPVVAALALGGLLMIGLDLWRRRTGVVPPPAASASPRPPAVGGYPDAAAGVRTLESITVREALLIGCVQCLALWPGTSRAMVTIVAGLLLGLPATAAAEYSFLLALPTLGAATLFDAVTGGEVLWRETGPLVLAGGFVTAGIAAALAIRGFIAYLTRHGLAPFGWYRIGLAGIVWIIVTQ